MSATDTHFDAAGRVFGLDIPDVPIGVNVHTRTPEQFNALVADALEAALPLKIEEGKDSGWWAKVGEHPRSLTIFPPHDLPRYHNAFQEAIDRRLAQVKFIELPPPITDGDADRFERHLEGAMARVSVPSLDAAVQELDARVAAEQDSDRRARS
jgi:hypothetical protein